MGHLSVNVFVSSTNDEFVHNCKNPKTCFFFFSFFLVFCILSGEKSCVITFNDLYDGVHR